MKKCKSYFLVLLIVVMALSIGFTGCTSKNIQVLQWMRVVLSSVSILSFFLLLYNNLICLSLSNHQYF